MRRVIVNADDYAMDGGVDAAILALAARGAVTATSAMVLSPFWREAASALKDAPLDKGLHLDFTSPFASDASPAASLGRLILLAHAGQLGRAPVRQAIDRQFDAFEAALGAPPDFVDGHQHVHHLPVIRETLLDALKARYGGLASRIRLRCCMSRRWRGVKAAIVERTGAPALERLAKARGHATNTDFAGVYDFGESAALPRLWGDWFARAEGEEPLIMCHPAIEDGGARPAPADPIRAARLREYAWLSSERFLELCQAHRVSPARWRSA